VKKPTVAIVGLGLIGGSLARALSRAGYPLVGVDRDPVCRRARRTRGLAASFESLEEAVPQSDVIVLAAPPGANLELLPRVARLASRGSVVTDVGSVKGPICREARRLGLSAFVGGHPMAGREGSGFSASKADLFRARPWILTSGSPRALRSVRSLLRSLGARGVFMSPEHHDRLVAFLSHVPQLVSFALLEAAARDPVAARHLDAAGPGFRDMTRLGKSPRPLWREILRENSRDVARALTAFQRALGRPI
jgi:prephenate dehydrogenase